MTDGVHRAASLRGVSAVGLATGGVSWPARAVGSTTDSRSRSATRARPVTEHPAAPPGGVVDRVEDAVDRRVGAARGEEPVARHPAKIRLLSRCRVGSLTPSSAERETAGLMGCLIALLALLSPRVALFFLALFSDVLSDAYDSWIIPLIGFFVLPWTTLTYAAFWDWGAGRHVTGVEWFFVTLAFLIDLGSFFGGRQAWYARAAT
jgi:hypothetical protein